MLSNNYNTNIVNIEIDNNIVYLTFLDYNYTNNEINKCQEKINIIYDNAYKNNIKYIVNININDVKYSNVKNLKFKDFINLYNNNIINTEFYVNNINIITKNNWQIAFLNFFLLFYKIKVKISIKKY
tara:strand:- start:211 stop:591 length:381 start_codon:yes stop_codon:yes gene_type:complete